MSEAPSPTRSWWTTLPGVLTGVAALLTAGTGLLVALVQSGILGPGSAAPRPTPVAPTANTERPATPLSPTMPAGSSTPAGRVPAADAVPPMVPREPIDLGSMSVQVLDVQRASAPNGMRLRVAYRIQAGDRTNGYLNFRDLLRLVADGAPRTMERTTIQPAGTQADYVQRLPAHTAVDVVSEFLVPPAEDLVLHFTELLPDIPMSAKPGERVARRRVAP